MAKKQTSPVELPKVKLPVQAMTQFVQKYFGMGLALAAAFLIGVLWTEVRYLKNGYQAQAPSTAPTQQIAPDAQAPQQVTLTDELWKEVLENPVAELGKKDAKVTMVEFTDFECPFCSRFYNDSYKALVKKYVESGKMRVVFHNLPLSFHPNAHISAQAVECAADQNKYNELHDLLFQKQTEWASEPTDTVSSKYFEAYAKEIGMNVAAFKKCVDSGEKKAAVDADVALGTKVGASGTPTFYFNKEQLVGAQPLATFESLIDGML